MNRAINIVLSLFLIIIAFVPFVFVLILVVFFIDTNPIFTQSRIGKNEEMFNLYKLRTMKNSHSESGKLLPDQDRLTKLGTFLRSTSIDELPSLINILKGDMNFIGPRPLLPEYLPFFSTKEKKRHLIAPGITGLAQVKGRNMLTWEQKFTYDIFYVENKSLKLDLQIILMTLKVVFLRTGISPKEGIIMPRLDTLRKRNKTHE